jgi:predicted CoA-binding protein
LPKQDITKEVDNILEMQHKVIPVIPEIDYKSIIKNEVSFDEIANIKRRGAFNYKKCIRRPAG